ncbi:MAG: hypothetical protein ABIJ92_04355 [Candidatus Aenigmatarchaeota archaeon]
MDRLMEPYYKTLDEYEDITKKRRRESLIRHDEIDLDEPEVREVQIIKKRSMPRFEESKLTALKRDDPLVIGSLFDKVEFLQIRVSEIENTMKEREVLHKTFLKEIEEDIEEKDDMMNHITDIDEKRNFKLDVSILRKEKRQENILFWRDGLELKTELRELLEQLQTENKILKIFNDLGGTND